MVEKEWASKFLRNHISQLTLHSLWLQFQELTYQEFLFLTASKSIVYLEFANVEVYDENGIIVPFEDILNELPNIEQIV